MFDSSFIPPTSTRDNAQNWYNEGSDIVNDIVQKQEELVQQIKAVIQNEVDQLEKQSETTRVKKMRVIQHDRFQFYIGKTSS